MTIDAGYDKQSEWNKSNDLVCYLDDSSIIQDDTTKSAIMSYTFKKGQLKGGDMVKLSLHGGIHMSTTGTNYQTSFLDITDGTNSTTLYRNSTAEDSDSVLAVEADIYFKNTGYLSCYSRMFSTSGNSIGVNNLGTIDWQNKDITITVSVKFNEANDDDYILVYAGNMFAIRREG